MPNRRINENRFRSSISEYRPSRLEILVYENVGPSGISMSFSMNIIPKIAVDYKTVNYWFSLIHFLL